MPVTRAISGHVPRDLSRLCSTNSRMEPFITLRNLAENRLPVKRHAAIAVLGHLWTMGINPKRKAPKTPLQATLMQRIAEEMGRQGVNPTSLGRRAEEMGLGNLQRTLADVLNGSDPRIETVYTVATALGVSAWRLFQPYESQKVVHLPTPPPIMGRGKENGLQPRKRRRKG